MKFSSSSFMLDHGQLLPNLQISMIQHLRGPFQTSKKLYLILMLFTVIKDTKKKKKRRYLKWFKLIWVAYCKDIIAVSIKWPQMKDDNCTHSLKFIFVLITLKSFIESFILDVHMLFLSLWTIKCHIHLHRHGNKIPMGVHSLIQTT